MNDKMKLPIAIVLIAVAVVILIVAGNRFFGAPASMPAPKMVSLGALVRMQQTNPSALTQDQKDYLARTPESVKAASLNAKPFSLSDVGAKRQASASN